MKSSFAYVCVRASAAAAPVNELWVMKHKPKEPKDLIGNGDKIRQLREWLANWHRVCIGACVYLNVWPTNIF